MADLNPGMELAERLDERYAQLQERRVSERQAAQAAAAERVDAARRTEQIQQEQAAQSADQARSLDAEQRRRDQQLAIDLRRLEEEQLYLAQAALEQVARAAENPNRGAIVDLFA